MSGAVSYYSGLAAEDQVASDYQRRGYGTKEKRWRGKSGEIDLIAQNADGFVFIEVKKARDFVRAVERITQRQLGRIYRAAEEYLGQYPNALDTTARIDVALVNDQGQIEIIENAYGH